MRRAFLVGAGGAVGEATALALADDGWNVTASMHHQRDDVAQRLAVRGVNVVRGDIGNGADWADAGAGADVWVFTPRLDFTAAALARVTETSPRLVLMSSNNVAIHPDAPSYRTIAAAEAKLKARFSSLAIIRPTMIYGDPRLPTMMRLLRIARTWPLIPAPMRARVQPVFHEDLARLAAGLASGGENGVYATGGPDVVTMAELFAAARRASGGNGIVVPTPAAVIRMGAALLKRDVLSAEQAARIDRDRIAVPQTPLPRALAPRVRLAEGLARLWAAMRGEASG